MLWGRYYKKSKYYFLYKQKQKGGKFCPVRFYAGLQLLSHLTSFRKPTMTTLIHNIFLGFFLLLLLFFSWVSEQTAENEDAVLIQILLLGFDDVLGRHPLSISITNSSVMPYFQTRNQKLQKDLHSSLTVGPERSTWYRIAGNICYLDRFCFKCLAVT